MAANGGGGDRPSHYLMTLIALAGLIISLLSLGMPLMTGLWERVSRLEQKVTALCDRTSRPCP
jgi:hypothetical protein